MLKFLPPTGGRLKCSYIIVCIIGHEILLFTGKNRDEE